MDKNGYKLNEIDDMDIHFFWEVYEKQVSEPEVVQYADEVPWL